METTDNTVVQKARAWVDNVNTANGLASGWRLEVISKRYRYQKDAQSGTKKRVPVRIRRFARGLPVGLVHEAIRYLDSLAPYTGFIFNGERVALNYRPTNTTWMRDDQHSVDGNASGTYTLVQDLIEEGSLDDFEAPSTGSCSEEVVTKWVWDATTVEDLPQWEQGVTYSIQAVNRKEDGTFDYALIRRRALTQHLPETVTECNEFEAVYTETWDNVYGTPPNFTEDTGTPISIPAPCESVNGTSVAIQIAENQDCTFRISVTKRVTKKATSADSCARTKFEHTDGEVVRGANAKLGEAPAAKNGITETRRSEVRPDGKYDTTREVRTELPVSEAVVEVRKTIRGTTKSVTDRNQKSPASYSSLAVGESVRSSMTPGGLYDNVRERVEAKATGTIAEGCSKTIFDHTDQSTDNVTSKPGKCVEAAGGGKWHERRVSLTDLGTWDVQITDHGELPVSGAVVEAERTLRGTSITTTNRNQVASAGTGGLALGESRRSSQTNGGRWDTVVRKVDAVSAGTIAENCSRNAEAHTHGTTNNQTDKPVVERTVETNVEHTCSARLTDYGTWDVDTQTVTHNPLRAQVVSGSSAVVTQTTSLYRNSIAPVSATGAAVNVEVRANASLNSHGSFDGQVETSRYNTLEKSVTVSEASKVTMSTVGVNSTAVPVVSAGAGEEASVSISLNSHGSIDYSMRNVKHIPRVLTSETRWATETTRTTTQTIDQNTNLTVPGEFGTVTGNFDGYGTVTSSSTQYEPKEVSSGWITWQSENVTPSGRMKYEHGVYIFKNYTRASLDAAFGGMKDKNGSCRANINQYGRYDGELAYSALKSWNLDNGAGGSQQGGIHSGTVTVVGRDGYERKFYTKTYFGSGNRGAEASTRANQIIVEGLSLGERTYVTGYA